MKFPFLFKILVNSALYYPFWIKYPSTVFLEVTNACNASCPLCPIGAKVDKRKKGFMKLDEFKRIIDENSFIKKIIINFAGETLVNKDIYEMIKYAESKNINVLIGTNGSLLNPEKLLESNVSDVLFALDGLTEKTYKKYRVGLNFNLVKDNLIQLCKKKQEMKSKTNIILQFIVMSHNEHEIPDIIKFAKEIGVDRVELKQVVLSNFVKKSKEELMKFLPENKEYWQYYFDNDKIKPLKPFICDKLFFIQILFNGDVTICCFDHDGAYVIGNILTEPFKDIWKSKKYKEIRRMIIKQELDICKKCSNTFIAPKVIKLSA